MKHHAVHTQPLAFVSHETHGAQFEAPLLVSRETINLVCYWVKARAFFLFHVKHLLREIAYTAQNFCLRAFLFHVKQRKARWGVPFLPPSHKRTFAKNLKKIRKILLQNRVFNGIMSNTQAMDQKHAGHKHPVDA